MGFLGWSVSVILPDMHNGKKKKDTDCLEYLVAQPERQLGPEPEINFADRRPVSYPVVLPGSWLIVVRPAFQKAQGGRDRGRPGEAEFLHKRQFRRLS